MLKKVCISEATKVFNFIQINCPPFSWAVSRSNVQLFHSATKLIKKLQLINLRAIYKNKISI